MFFFINRIQIARKSIYKVLNLYNNESNYTNIVFIQIRQIARIEKTIAANYNFIKQ